MTTRRGFMATAGFGLGAAALGGAFFGDSFFGGSFLGLRGRAAAEPTATFPLSLTDAEWHERLTPVQYDILRDAGTERPYTSQLNDEHRRGTFTCAACDRKLYASDTKFDSGTGWPSFYQALPHAVVEITDRSFGFTRTAVSCANCGGHLGHVFDDGPQPTGLRYCMNGVAMKFLAA